MIIYINEKQLQSNTFIIFKVQELGILEITKYSINFFHKWIDIRVFL